MASIVNQYKDLKTLISELQDKYAEENTEYAENACNGLEILEADLNLWYPLLAVLTEDQYDVASAVLSKIKEKIETWA